MADGYNSTVQFLDIEGGAAGAGGTAGAGGGNGGVRWPTKLEADDINRYGGIDQPYDGVGVLREVQDAYTEEEKDAQIDRQYGTGWEQQERARSPEQQTANYPYYYWNLAQDNPRGNLNRMSYDTTLRMSRLADAVNNRLHWNPGTASTIMGASGAKTLGQGTGDVERWAPMETEETRQMEANRGIDRRAREAGVDLQSRIQAYPQDIQEAMDEKARELRYYISQMDDQTIRNWQQTVINEKYGGSWRNFWNEMLKRFLVEYGLEVTDRKYREFLSLIPNSANLWARFFVGDNVAAKPLFAMYMDQMLVNVLQSDVSDETKSMAMDAYTRVWSLINAGNDASAFLTGFRRAFGGGGNGGGGSSWLAEMEASEERTKRLLGYNPGGPR